MGTSMSKRLSMDTREVACCDDCPFLQQSESEAFTYCTANVEALVDDDVDRATARQPWCPLDRGAILVKAAGSLTGA
jgi:hypothetical protein